MQIDQLWLTSFRSYERAELRFPPGLTAVLGENGRGKTNLLEAVALVSRGQSFRGAPGDALVRHGADAAYVRAASRTGDREVLFEAELPRHGRARMQLNRQRVSRRSDLLETYQVTVFSPDDLDLVKGGPAGRRDVLDELVVALAPRHDAVRMQVERALRQRNALLRQVGGRLAADTEATLDVWDERLGAAGAELGHLRAELVARLAPIVAETYRELSGRGERVELRLDAPWQEAGLVAALRAARVDDVRRGVTTVGPHRDELEIGLAGMPARTHASQGEQRTLALALRLAGHRLVTAELGEAPTLLLDDVFSELDERRGTALLRSLPPGQAILTSATPLPSGAAADVTLDVDDTGVRER